MKYIKHVLIFIAIFFFCLKGTKAYCSDAEKQYFKTIEDKFTASFTYNEHTKIYTVVVKNPMQEKYVSYLSGSPLVNTQAKEYIENGKSEGFVFDTSTPGEISFTIKATTSECDETVKEYKLILPKYNKYYGNDACEGIEDFVLCQKEYDKEITNEEFNNRVEIYKNNASVSSNKESSSSNQNNIEEIESIMSQIVNYIKQNLIMVISITIFTVLLIVTIVLKVSSTKKSRRLE